MEAKYDWLDNTIVPINYPKIKKVFSTSKSILESTDDELYEAIHVCHAFENRFRFYSGGAATQKESFLKNNDLKSVREILVYLVFDHDDVIVRMANCIFNPDYKILEFGRSCVQELIGWVGDKNLPVINGRTTKVLRYFGYNIKQIS
jgi:hypothetical protein